MRNELAVFLAAALSSGGTWLLTRGDRASASPSPSTPDVNARSDAAPVSAPSVVLGEQRPAEGDIGRVLAEIRAIRERMDAAPKGERVVRAGSSTPGSEIGRTLDLSAFESATYAEITEGLAAVRRTMEQRLLAVPEGVKKSYAGLLAEPDTGIGRILQRGKFEALIETRGGGAYWSFATRSNSYDKSPDVELQQGKFSSGFYGSSLGYIVDLGATALDRVPTSPAALPASFDESNRALWEFLWSDRGVGDHGYSKEFTENARAVGAPTRATAVVGHTYVLRAVLPDEHDHLVAFASVEGDEDAQTLVHRVLRTFPMVSRRR